MEVDGLEFHRGTFLIYYPFQMNSTSRVPLLPVPTLVRESEDGKRFSYQSNGVNHQTLKVEIPLPPPPRVDEVTARWKIPPDEIY